MVVVNLLAATICWASQCYPALVGPKTPTGEFEITHMVTKQPGYGGDVLVFNDRGKSVDAIHRVWLLSPKQRRLERLQSGDPKQRQSITNGCINVMPEVYDKLRASGETKLQVVHQ